MAFTTLHDIEVCVEEGIFKIIPYRLYIDSNNNLTADTSTKGEQETFECKLTDKRNRELIGYVLDRENWDETREYWEGFSEWNTTGYLTEGDAPARIKKWLKKLKPYEISIGG